MKKVLFTTLTLLFLHSFVRAQTTQEEYNYITKGWKNHLDDGSDVKSGYEMTRLKSVNMTSGDGHRRKATLSAFKKTKNGFNHTVAYMITYQKNDEATEYICLPHFTSDESLQYSFAQALHDGKSDNSYRLQIITLLISTRLW